jgi:hypothetical protein
MNEAHKLSYEGKNGTNKYYQKNNELLEMEGGKPRTDQRGMISDYVEKAEEVEQIAKKYGDSYSTQNNSKVKLKGIPDSDLPLNSGTQHNYPKGQSLHSYYTQMQRTAKEALELINSGAPKEKILKKIAEHYQYAANARPYQQINNSLYMNEINTLLQKAGLNTMPHGIMDHVAMRLQPDKFEKYFIDQYYATSIQTN